MISRAQIIQIGYHPSNTLHPTVWLKQKTIIIEQNINKKPRIKLKIDELIKENVEPTRKCKNKPMEIQRE